MSLAYLVRGFVGTLAMLVACQVWCATVAAEVRFAEPLVVVREAGAIRITFAAGAPTDVEIAVLDGDGKIVRHLAAGQLGDNAPAPLQAGSLTQKVMWDGRDDLGNLVAKGNFRIRVRLGLEPRFGEMIGDHPAAVELIKALATGPSGEVFVFHNFGSLSSGDHSLSCLVLDRNGNYLRTIVPMPANLSDEQLQGVKRLTLEDGTKVPFLYQAETRSLLPATGMLPPQRPVVTRDGRLAFVGIHSEPRRGPAPGLNQVVVLNVDGSVPEQGLLGTKLAELSAKGAQLALAPDEQTIYATGVYEEQAPADAEKHRAERHVVYRFGWQDTRPQVFVGTLGEAGSDAQHLHSPQGIAVDQQGNVYVADRGNNRVAVFQSDGGLLGAIMVDRPERVEVDRRTGAVYVIAGERVDQLLKFASWSQPEPVARLKLPSMKHDRYTAIMALDDSASPPVLWVTSPKGRYAGMDLLRIEDHGEAFAQPVDIGRITKQSQPSAGSVLGMDLDRQRGRLFVNNQLYDLATKEWAAGLRESSGRSTEGLGVGSVGLDGNFYTQIFPRVVRRIGPDLKKLPFAAVDEEANGELLNPIQGSMRVRGRGITADPQGNVYVLWEDRVEATRGEAFNHVYVYDADGKLKKEKLIDSGIRSVNSVRLDYAGNVYVALGLRPGNELLPPGLETELPSDPKDPDATGGVNLYPLLYGSIAKFGPEGGVIRPDAGGVKCNYAWGTPIEVKGAHWIFSGSSPVVSWRVPGTGTPGICNCESARFDVDPYGRSFFTDAARFRVGVLDTNGNLIRWFGSYGNVDSAGPQSRIPRPEIPLYWPYNVSVDSDSAYVGDRFNRRVVRVSLNYAATATADVP